MFPFLKLTLERISISKTLRRQFMDLLKSPSRAGGALRSICLFLLSCLAAHAHWSPKSLGNKYARLSEVLWSAPNEYSHRILYPLLASITFLKGDLVVYFSAICLILSIFVVDRFLVKRTDPRFAFLGDAMFATAMPLLFNLYYPGYPEAMSLLFLVSILACYQRRFLPWLLFTLAMLNQECILIMAPFFIMLRKDEEKGWSRFFSDVIFFILLVVAYGVYRKLVVYYLHPLYGGSFYLGPLKDDPLHWLKVVWPKLWLAYFGVFETYWVLLGLFCWKAIQNKQFSLALGFLGSLLATVLMITIGGIDTTRMITYLAATFVAALAYLYRIYGSKKFFRICLICLILNVLIPNIYVTSTDVIGEWFIYRV